MVPSLRRASKAELAEARRKESARMCVREQPRASRGGGAGARGQMVQLTEPRSPDADG